MRYQRKDESPNGKVQIVSIAWRGYKVSLEYQFKEKSKDPPASVYISEQILILSLRALIAKGGKEDLKAVSRMHAA